MRYVLVLDGEYYVSKASARSCDGTFTTDRKDALRFWTGWGAREYLQNNIPSIYWHEIEPVNLWKLF